MSCPLPRRDACQCAFPDISESTKFRLPLCMRYTSGMNEQDINRRFEKLEHHNELARKKWRCDMKVLQSERKEMRAESEETIAKNESAIDRLLASNERLCADNERFHADIEKSVSSIITSITTRLIIGLAISVAFLSLVVVATGLFLRT